MYKITSSVQWVVVNVGDTSVVILVRLEDCSGSMPKNQGFNSLNNVCRVQEVFRYNANITIQLTNPPAIDVVLLG